VLGVSALSISGIQLVQFLQWSQQPTHLYVAAGWTARQVITFLCTPNGIYISDIQHEFHTYTPLPYE
jgi:hypothetical protein